MDAFDLLITDRTEADVSRLKALNAKGWDDMTDDEKREWKYGVQIPLSATDGPLICSDGPLTVGTEENKGAYSFVTLNRVGEVCGNLYAVISDMGYAVPGYTVLRTDWTQSEIPSSADMDSYLGTVAAIKAALSAAQELPDGMGDLTPEGANNIEKLLIEAELILSGIGKVFLRAGMPWAVSGNAIYVKN